MNLPAELTAYGSSGKRRGVSIVDYARGAGGRIDALPAVYLDMIAESVLHGHPKYVTRTVRELLVNGRFARSRHPQLRDLSVADLRRIQRERSSRQYLRRLELHPELAPRRRRRSQTVTHLI